MIKTGFAALVCRLFFAATTVELEREIALHRWIILASAAAVVLLSCVIALQALIISRLRRARGAAAAGASHVTSIGVPPDEGGKDAGLLSTRMLFKYSPGGRTGAEKTVTIGANAGSIQTMSTEIVNGHLRLTLRPLRCALSREGSPIEDYEVEMARGGNALVRYPGESAFRVMSLSERLSVGPEPDGGLPGAVVVAGVEMDDPVRFRLGGELDADGSFPGGYFEFHLFTRNYELALEEGAVKTARHFFVRVFDINPGYDEASRRNDGLCPMKPASG